MEKVVKCKKCDLYFGHSEKNTKCPFCYTVYSEVEEKDTSFAEASTDKSAAKKDEKGVAKNRKKFFQNLAK